MTRRIVTAIGVGLAVWVIPAIAFAQAAPAEGGEGGVNRNWVFYFAFLIGLGFLGFVAFVAVYYLFAVVARQRKYAAPVAIPVAATVPAGGTVAAPAAAAPAPAPAAAAAPAAPAAPSAPAAAPARPPAPAVPAGTGGVPKIDPNNLPDGIDAVTRGRLKKLAVLQERGQEPPADLLSELKPVLDQMGGAPAAPAAEAAPAQVEEAPAAPAAEAVPAPAAEEPAPAEAVPAEPAAAAAPAASEPAADTGGLPRIDPNNLPDGIDAVARGRLKKLAIFQERGDTPPADLVEKLKPVLDQMGS